MKLDNDIKLDFSDVLLLPNWSDLNSRNDVIIEREFKFKYSSYVWTGVPIIVSNMDTTGTIEMARVLQKYKVLTCLHKFYTEYDIPEDLDKNYYIISTGTSEADLERLDKIVKKHEPNFICIDVANGYHKKFIDTVKELRKKYPDKVLVGGNVVTNNLVQELILNAGLDIVKVGIGSGCFTKDTRVLMANGTYKNINEIQIGEKIINMNGEPVNVLNVMNQGVKKVLQVKINNYNDYTYVTEDHMYWVYNKKNKKYEWININSVNSDYNITNIENKEMKHYDIVDKKYFGEEETWDIEVDCPTHSFIANNSIVHNSVCTTRLQTGVGYPQFSAVVECSDAAHGIDGHIISDGGIQNVGDISKAFGAGADFVMCGSMFAGHDESGGELVEIDNKKYKVFYGMSSSTAMNKYHGGVAHYRSAEGKTVKVNYKGPVDDTIKHILGGIRSTMTYIGAKKIKHIPRSANFIRVNNIVNKIYNGNEI